MTGTPSVKIVVVIPAHMASIRFPGKILHPFFGLPMIEHVRRRALLSKHVMDVFVATCDDDIAEVVSQFGGKVIMTNNHHKNGTTRVAEAIQCVDCSHVIVLQGDEPLVLPGYVDKVASAIKAFPERRAWNATAPIQYSEELDRHSFVKCVVGSSDRILCCFRKSPFFSEVGEQRKFVRKILGIIAYNRASLVELASLSPARIELSESIEQMRILEYGVCDLYSVPVELSLPSVNEIDDSSVVIEYLQNNIEQQKLLAEILGE